MQNRKNSRFALHVHSSGRKIVQNAEKSIFALRFSYCSFISVDETAISLMRKMFTPVRAVSVSFFLPGHRVVKPRDPAGMDEDHIPGDPEPFDPAAVREFDFGYVQLMENLKDAAAGENGSLHIGFLKGYERSDLSVLARRFRDLDELMAATEEELTALPERVDKLGLDLCRFSILTPYPGTKLYEEMERSGRITSKDWALYNQHHVVFAPKHIPAERLHILYREVWKRTYTWRRIFRRVLHSPTLFTIPGVFLLGANIGFKFLGIDEKRRCEKQQAACRCGGPKRRTFRV